MNAPCLRSHDTNELLNRVTLGLCTALETELARRLDEAQQHIDDLEDQVQAFEVLLEPDEGTQDAPP